MRVQDGRTLWQRVRPYFTVFDAQLAIIMLMLLSVGLVTLYSAGIAIPGKVADQLRNICMAFLALLALCLLAGAITMIYFAYVFVNMGLGAGILMSIQHHSRGVRGAASVRAWGAAA